VLDFVGALESDANEPIDHRGNGSTARIVRKIEQRRKAGRTCCWPIKKEPVAMKSPKHMR